ncbi:hypothetical protein AIOL_004076 [Candidatus Rhodobacter oscarellae]|uniref:Uncharacterized protein n=1 Tax=Candidatus Rhodobacter oscarellae TaxID=1675527 RepID=A0A0J9E8J8_9RHOB|nr:DUF6478 family protein [Candidatus Rhodobacter lobularis]KMW59095.1 hypothetical protein AIOL_004076 [Candidatus Rhodobacter lobularis]
MRLTDLIEGVFHRRVLRRWGRIAGRAERLDLEALSTLRAKARQIRRLLDRVIFVAEGRLTLPAVGSNAIVKPLYTDWAYRPELWRGPVSPLGIVAVASKTDYGKEVRVYHDCRQTELTLRQTRNSRESDLAPYGLRMDVFRFDGSFLSLVIELPNSAVEGLERRHVIRLSTVVELEKPLEIFARLNVKHGPNVEQIVRELPMGEEDAMVEFDLAYTKLNERRLEKMWLDLIFEGAEMNQIMLRDVVMTRRPRAEM